MRNAPLILLLAVLAGPALAEPPLGAYKGAGCDGVKKLPEFTGWLGRKTDVAVDFLNQESWDKLISSVTWIANCWKPTGLPLSLALPMLVKAPADTLANGAAGGHDDVFRTVAQILVARGFPDATLRIGWEFNGNWYPWAAAPDPSAWVAYYRRIVDVMRKEPGAKFRFEWCPNLGKGTLPPDSVYPGDDVVDIIGEDIYNQNWSVPYPPPDKNWNWLLTQPFGLQWQRDFAATHRKQVAFAEWGTGTRPDGHGGGDDPYFIDKMADWIASGNTAYHAYWDYRASDYNALLSDGHQTKAALAFLVRYSPDPTNKSSSSPSTPTATPTGTQH